MTNEIRYRNKIVYLSFVLALLIVVRHSSGIGLYQSLSGALFWIETFFSYATDLVVPMFFALSGYLFYQNFDFSKLKQKWNTRFHSLVVPFVIWNLVGFVFTWTIFHIQALSNSMNGKLPDYTIGGWLYDVFIDTKYNVTWFIRNLIVYVIVTPVFYPLLKNRLGGAILLLLILIAVLFCGGKYLNYSLPYLFGGYMGIHFKDYCQQRYDRNLIVASSIILFVSIIAEAVVSSPQYGTMVPLRVLQIPLIWIISDVLAKKTEPCWWMRISFFIYLSHHMILESVEKLFWISFGDNIGGASTDFILAPIITILIIIGLASLLRKTPMWTLINGGRAS